jgi:hypothetical protein
MGWVNIGGAAIGAAGSYMGGKGSKSGPSTPKFVKRQLQRGYGALNAATDRPASEAIAPQNADQIAGMNMIRQGAGTGMSNIGFANEQARRAAGGVTPGDVQGFFNPYEDQVVASAMNDIGRQRDLNLLQINTQAEKAGAFGGDRATVARALASEDFNRQMATTAGGLRYGGYQSAIDAAFRNNDAFRVGAGGLLEAANAERQGVYGDAAMRQGVGDTQYAYDQSLLDHPLKMAQAQIDAGASGMGVQRPGSAPGGGVSGALAGAAGGYDLFSKLFPNGFGRAAGTGAGGQAGFDADMSKIIGLRY